MPKSKTTKPKPTNKTDNAENAGSHETGKSAPSKKYQSTKAAGLTNKQKAALARQLMICAGDLMDVQDAKFNDEDLVGIDRKFMGVQLAAWVSYLPGQYWDARLPQPIRARGRRKL